MSLIQVADLTFAYEGSFGNIFEHTSFQLDTDWKLGFIGRNGRGKTTFLKLLLGEYEYRGKITASVQFDYFPFLVKDPAQSVLAVAAAINPDFERWELVREFSLLDLPDTLLERTFATLSNGEQTKVLLAVLFLRQNHFLLIDEPTNHLDLEAREAVSDYLNSKRGFIVVSHDRAFLDRCIDHVLSINKTSIEVQRGNFSSWWENKSRQDANELQQNDKLKKDIKRLSEAARRTADWSDRVEQSKYGGRPDNSMVDRGFIGHQAAKMMKRAKSIEARQNKAISEKSHLLKNIEKAEALQIHPLDYQAPALVVLQEVAIVYDGRAVSEPVSFTIRPGERIALHGRNGSGKSSLLQLILGKGLDHAGTLTVGSQLVISSVPQDASFLQGSLKDFARERRLDESLFRAILNKLDFEKNQFDKDMGGYSAGQQKKVLLAASLSEKAHLYIWDEPLNYIDVLSRLQIENLLQDCTATLLFVEHDRAFCEAIATKTVEIMSR